MADDGDGGGGGSNTRSMDLNLYLGLPRLAPPRSLDLGSDLALGSSSFSSSSSSSSSSMEESRLLDGVMSVVSEPSDTMLTASPDLSNAAANLTLPSTAVGDDDTPSYAASPPSSQVQVFPTIQASDDPVEDGNGSGEQYLSYIPLSPIQLSDEPPVGSGSGVGGSDSPTVPYLPLRVPVSMVPSYQPIHLNADAGGRENAPPLDRDLLQNPQFRLRRLIELHHRWRRVGRFRSSPLQYRDESPNFAASSRASPEVSDRLVETSGKGKVGGEGIIDEGLEEKEEKNGSAVNFECNICLDIAKEPVVTSCGHLFCWPCLYQWLHLHCDHKECPVCKGEVTESNIVPIYGRGSSETEAGKKCEGNNSGVKIPPRPHGRRLESWRQQIQRPFSRRLGEGIANSWRRVLDRERHNGTRLDMQGDPSLAQGIVDTAPHRVLTRLRARRFRREEDNMDPGFGSEQLPANASSMPQDGSNASSMPQDGNDIWQRFPLSGFPTAERLASITADLARIMSRFASSSNHSGAALSARDPQNPEDRVVRPTMGLREAADQASASSTMAVIQGDTGFADNNAGSSRQLRRRRRRTNTSGSLDVDGGDLHARKRRRLN